MRRSATPSVPAVGVRTRCTYLKRMHPATVEDRVAGARLTPDALEAAAHAANDGIAVTGDAFGTAADLAELVRIFVSRGLLQTATPPVPTE
jgi:CO/xanthine dehydrogenase FAD-binding subunit